MSKPKTRILFILDKSGSMETTKKQAISGLNEHIQEAIELSKDHDLKCSLLTFNSEVYEHLWDVPADQLEEANAEDFICNGGTAMKDAIGYGLTKLKETAGKDDEDTAYLITVFSDGETNSDKANRFKDTNKLKALVESCQASGKFTISYVGCSEEYLKKISEETSVPIANMAVWDNSTEEDTSFGFCENRKKMKEYFCLRSDGHTATANYASDDSAKCADYTKKIAAQPVNNLYVPKIVTNNNAQVSNVVNASFCKIDEIEKRDKAGWLSKSTEAVW